MGGCGFKIWFKKFLGFLNRLGEIFVFNVKFVIEWLDWKGVGIFFNYCLIYWDFCKELGV